LLHDDYGTRVGKQLGMTAADVTHLEPLAGQILTDEDQRRLQSLGNNGDTIDATVWGTWTSAVHNYQASADEVLAGMEGAQTEPAPAPEFHEQQA
jgi:catalase